MGVVNIYIYMYVYMCVCLCMCVCMYVCVCVYGRAGGRTDGRASEWVCVLFMQVSAHADRVSFCIIRILLYKVITAATAPS